MTLHEGQGVYGRTSDYSNPAPEGARPTFTGEFNLAGENTLANIILLPSAGLLQFGVKATDAVDLMIEHTDIGAPTTANRYQNTAVEIISSQLTIQTSRFYSGLTLSTQRRGIRIEQGSSLDLTQSLIDVIGNNSVTGISVQEGTLSVDNSAISIQGNTAGGEKIGINTLSGSNTQLNDTDIIIQMPTPNDFNLTLIGLRAAADASVVSNGGTILLNANSTGTPIIWSGFGAGSFQFNGTICRRDGVLFDCNATGAE